MLLCISYPVYLVMECVVNIENDNSCQNFLVFMALRYLFLENIDVQSKLHC